MRSELTVSAGNQFTQWKQYAGGFLLVIVSDPGSNTVRVQCCTDPNDAATIVTLTDDDGVAEGFSDVGTFAIDSNTVDLYWRAGVPTADYSSGSFDLVLAGKG